LTQTHVRTIIRKRRWGSVEGLQLELEKIIKQLNEKDLHLLL